MARSGPQKLVRQSVTGSGQPQGVVENVGLLLWSPVPGCRGCARVPPGSGLRGGCLQLVQEVVQGRDAFLQAFALARLCHHLAGAAGAVEGVTGQDLPVVEHTLGKGLAARVGPQVSGEACRRHRNGAHRAAQAASRLPGGGQEGKVGTQTHTTPEDH